jgi:hypothetical protein
VLSFFPVFFTAPCAHGPHVFIFLVARQPARSDRLAFTREREE